MSTTAAIKKNCSLMSCWYVFFDIAAIAAAVAPIAVVVAAVLQATAIATAASTTTAKEANSNSK